MGYLKQVGYSEVPCAVLAAEVGEYFGFQGVGGTKIEATGYLYVLEQLEAEAEVDAYVAAGIIKGLYVVVGNKKSERRAGEYKWCNLVFQTV